VTIPGWYPDPAGSGQMRYWSGYAWTDARYKPSRGLPVAWAPVVMALIGLVVIAIFAIPSDPNRAPTCDGKTMGPGDRCVFANNPSRNFTYEEKLREQADIAAHPWPFIGFGIALFVVGLILAGFSFYNRRRAAHT